MKLKLAEKFTEEDTIKACNIPEKRAAVGVSAGTMKLVLRLENVWIVVAGSSDTAFETNGYDFSNYTGDYKLLPIGTTFEFTV